MLFWLDDHRFHFTRESTRISILVPASPSSHLWRQQNAKSPRPSAILPVIVADFASFAAILALLFALCQASTRFDENGDLRQCIDARPSRLGEIEGRDEPAMISI